MRPLPSTSDQHPQQHCVAFKRIEMLVSGGRGEVARGRGIGR